MKTVGGTFRVTLPHPQQYLHPEILAFSLIGMLSN